MKKQTATQDIRKGFAGSAFQKYFARNWSLIVALLIMCVALTISTPHFLTSDNILVVMRQISTNAMVAFGMTFVILMGGIDLTVGSLIAVTGIMTSFLIARMEMSILLAVLIGLLLGVLVGTINGLIITKGKMPPFIVTLAISFICKGFTYIISGGKPISITNSDAFSQIGNGYLSIIPLPVIYTFVLLLILSYVLYRTRFGRHVYAIGGNIEAAKYSGVNVIRPQVISYMLVGFISGACGVIITARLYSGQPTIGADAELDAIAAVILGGASLNGGAGTLGGSFLGAIIIGVVNNGLNLLGVNSYWQNVAKGIIILLAVYIDVIKRTRSAQARIKESSKKWQ